MWRASLCCCRWYLRRRNRPRHGRGSGPEARALLARWDGCRAYNERLFRQVSFYSLLVVLRDCDDAKELLKLLVLVLMEGGMGEVQGGWLPQQDNLSLSYGTSNAYAALRALIMVQQSMQVGA